jgi:hypothetical protein
MVVLLINEKKIQVLDRAQPRLPLRPGASRHNGARVKAPRDSKSVYGAERIEGHGHRAPHAAPLPEGVRPPPQDRRGQGPRRQANEDVVDNYATHTIPRQKCGWDGVRAGPPLSTRTPGTMRASDCLYLPNEAEHQRGLFGSLRVTTPSRPVVHASALGLQMAVGAVSEGRGVASSIVT